MINRPDHILFSIVFPRFSLKEGLVNEQIHLRAIYKLMQSIICRGIPLDVWEVVVECYITGVLDNRMQFFLRFVIR